MLQTIDMCSGWEFSAGNGPFEEVTLPHAPAARDGLAAAGGSVYRLRFFARPGWRDKIVSLEIGAAMQTARIFVNDRYQFTHFGGYQRFTVPLSDAIAYGEENVLRVELDGAPGDDAPPGKEAGALDFLYGGGLYREARLLVSDRLRITGELEVSVPAGGGVFIRTERIVDGRATLSLSCHVLDDVPPRERWEHLGAPPSPDPVSMRATFLADDGRVLAVAVSDERRIRPMCDATFRVEAVVPEAPLWTPASPRLCRALVEVLRGGRCVDRREIPFGVRTVAFRRDGFYLNGVRTRLMGTNRHMAYPCVGNAVPANAQRRDAALIKRGGHDFVRLSHYNQHPAFIEACDELGVMVMAAIPGWQHFALNGHFVGNVFRDARELVRSLRNHPSVILWEVSLNESYPPAWINAELHRIAHEEYPGDQCYTCGDAVGNYEGWDVLFFHDRLANREKPVIVREYGDWAFGGEHSTSRQTRADGMTGLMRQAWNFQWSLNVARTLDGVVGEADWCFIDYDRGCSGRRETSGSVDAFRYPKPKFSFYRSQSCATPMLDAFRDGDRVVAFSNCDEIEVLMGDGEVVAPRRKADDGPDSPYNPSAKTSPGWETAQLMAVDVSGGNPYDGGNCRHLDRPPFTFRGLPAEGELLLVGYRRGREACRARLAVPGPASGVRVDVRDEGVPVVEGDLVFADATLVDENGALVPENLPVGFEAVGCELLGTSGPTTEAGVASCLVRAGKHGAISIRAKLERPGR